MEYPDKAPPDLFSMSPAPPSTVAAHPDAITAPPGYTSSRSRAGWTLALLGLTLAIQAVLLVVLLAQRSLLNRGAGQITLAEWQTSTGRVSHLATAQIILFLLTGVAFLLWLHRSYVNLVRLGSRDLRFTPGWAVGYWFIPILNIVRPKQILDELWRETNEVAETTSLTGLWWCALFTAGVTGRIGAAGGGSLEDMRSATTWLTVSCLADIAAAVITYRLVSSLTARQEERAGG